MTENERRHSERQRRIYDRGGESGKMLFNVKKTATYIGNGLLLSVGTGNSGDFINCVVELTHDFRIGGFVIHFFSVAAGCNQSAGFQQTQVVGNGRTAHVHDGGNIDDAFFHVAEDPENFQPCGIAELFQQDGYIVDCLLGRQAADDTFFIISMVVRKSAFIFCHMVYLFRNYFSYIVTYMGKWQDKFIGKES